MARNTVKDDTRENISLQSINENYWILLKMKIEMA
jgi:hypothetical protein